MTSRSNPRRLITGILLACALISVLSVVFVYWRQNVVQRREKYDRSLIARLQSNGRADEAAAVAESRATKSGGGTGQKDWESLEVQALTEAGNFSRLVTLYQNDPKSIVADERASVMTARALRFICRDEPGAKSLIASWQKTATHPEWWLALQVDTLLKTGQRQQAIALLDSKRFHGDAEAARLLRRAMLCDVSQPAGLQASWKYIQQAYRVAPKNPDVRSTRAQVLEQLQQYGQARVEYVAARLARPESSYLCDQLAEFYQRQGSTTLALQTWTQGMTTCPADFLAVKALFWSRMVIPLAVAVPEAEGAKTLTQSSFRIPLGTLTSLATYLRDQNPKPEFWDDERFDALPDSAFLARARAEVFYLRLCDALQKHKEARATELVSQIMRNPAFLAVNPDLVGSLRQVLLFRQTGSLKGSTVVPVRPGSTRHPLLLELDAATRNNTSLSASTAKLLRSPEAFSAIFLVNNWWEAALRLRPNGEATAVPEGMPDWYLYAMTQALRANRNDDVALAFAEANHSATSRLPAQQVLLGELLLAAGRDDDGEALLLKAAKPESDSALRAAWLLVSHYLETGKTDTAWQCLNRHPRLSKNQIGKEIAARICLMRGNTLEAERRYREIAPDSLEATTYLAKVAYARKDWQTARRYTLRLIGEMPDEMTLRENLREIDAHLVQASTRQENL